MVKKKRVILHFVPTEKMLLILQNLGYLNKHGRSTGRNLNEFLNRCIYDSIGVEDSSQNGKLLEKILQSEIANIQRAQAQRNKEHEKRLKELVQKLREAQNQKKVQDYEGKN